MEAQRQMTLNEKLKNLDIKPNTKLLRLLSLINMAYVLNTFQFSNLGTQLFCLGMRNRKNLLTQIISQASILAIFSKAIDPVML